MRIFCILGIFYSFNVFSCNLFFHKGESIRFDEEGKIERIMSKVKEKDWTYVSQDEWKTYKKYSEEIFSIQVKTLKKRRSKDKLVKEKSIVREIPLTTETVNSIFNYWKLEYGVVFPEDGNKPFFQTIGNGPYTKGPLTVKAVRDLIKRLKIGAKITGRITPHTFRHTFISRIARLNDLETARQLAGHESIVSTQVYLHSSLKLKREAIERLNYDGE